MASAQTLTPEQFAELQRVNPQLAAQIMAASGGNEVSGRPSAVGDWLGADGMPSRVSSAPAQQPMREQRAGKSNRGVPSDAPTPPKRQADTEGSKPSFAGDTARTNASAGARRTEPAAAKTNGPPTREVDKSVTRTATASEPPPAVETPQASRVAAEIFGPPMPQSLNEDIPASATEASTDTNVGVPDVVAASAAAAGGMPPVGGVIGRDEDVDRANAELARNADIDTAPTSAPASTSWRDIITSATNLPDKQLQQLGIDVMKLPPGERMRISAMGADKWLQRYGQQYLPKQSRQQAQR